MRKLSFFKGFQEQVLKAFELEDMLSLCKSLGYEEHKNEQVIFKVGDLASDKIYVLLSGQVEVKRYKKSEKKVKRRGFKKNKNQSLEISDFYVPPNRFIPTSKRGSMEYGAGNKINSFSLGKPLKTEANLRDCVSQILPNNSNLHHRSSLFLLESVVMSEITSLQINDESTFKSKEEIPKQEEDFESYEKSVHFIKEGEVFGEACLQEESSRRLSTALCKTDCQFVVMNKEFFDLMTENKEQDKENFLKSLFPSFNDIISYAELRYLRKSFTTEVFNKGSLVTMEGLRVAAEEAKMYLIFKGECKIEKNLELENNIPYDKSRPIVGNSQTVQVSFLGKGMIFGEEVLTNDNNEYSFNIRVSSEALFVYSIPKKEFSSKFFEKICQQVSGTFEKKKIQRENIFENIKKDYETKVLHRMPETVNYAKSVPISHLITRSASMSLNRYVHREQKMTEQKIDNQGSPKAMSPKAKTPISQPQQPQGKSSPSKRSSLGFSEMIQNELGFNGPIVKVEEKRMIKLIETDDPKKIKLENKMQFVAKIPYEKKNVEVPNPRNLENFKLFPETDPQKLKYLRVLKVKSTENFRAGTTLKAPTPTSSNNRFDSMLKDHFSYYEQQSQNLIDVKRPQTSDGKTPRERPTSSLPFSTPTSPKSPARLFAIERVLGTPQHKNRELRVNRNISTATSFNMSPIHQIPYERNFGEMLKRMNSPNQSFENTDGILTPDLRNSNFLESRIQESPKKHSKLRPSSQGIKSPGRVSFFNLEGVEETLITSNKMSSRSPRNINISSGSLSAKAMYPSVSVMNLQLVKPRTAHNKRLAEARDRQKRVFQKTRPESAHKNQGGLFQSLVNNPTTNLSHLKK